MESAVPLLVFLLLLCQLGLMFLGALACCVGMLPAAALAGGFVAAAYHSLAYPGNHYLRER